VHAGMSAHLVTARHNFFYRFGLSFGNPAQSKKGGFGVGAFQYIKNALPILVDAHFVVFPLVDGFCRFIVEDVKPFFDVESKYFHLFIIVCFLW
jgi:hypothetical protein